MSKKPKIELSPFQQQVLAAFDNDPKRMLTSGELARKAKIPVGMVGATLKKLADEHFLAAAPYEKTRLYTLTPLGQEQTRRHLAKSAAEISP